MIHLNCDYYEGTHGHILRRLVEISLEQTPGYEEGHYCAGVAGTTRSLCGQENAAAHLLVGNTQANMTVIASAPCPHQGVTGVVTVYISAHETGSIGTTDHKVLILPFEDGKTTAEQVKELYQAYIRDESSGYTVQSKMVYISNLTELDIIYTRSKLKNLYKVCRKYGLYLFVDGTRLAYGLAMEGNDLDPRFLVAACDVFCIGGTKAGALFGETMIILNDELRVDFCYHIKWRGGMLAKGRLLGTQFGEFLRDGLYPKLGAYADRLADKIRCACAKEGYPSLVENITNQIFPIMPGSLLESWKDKYNYTDQGKADESHAVIRLYTSWITSGEQVGILVNNILNS